MEILEINLKHFGQFTDQKLSFHSGVNAIYGGNETGKSTICSFIRGMLVGIEKARGRAAKDDEYTMREPWEQGSYFAGSMRFSCEGKVFLLERSFARNDRKVRLICETDGEELDPENGDLENLLDGINEVTFSNTFYMGNKSGETDQAFFDEIHNYMVNASSGQVSEIRVNKGMDYLKKKKKEFENERKKIIEEETIRVQEILMRQDYARQEAEELWEEEQNCIGQLQQLAPRDEEEPMLRLDDFHMSSRETRGLRIWKFGEILMTLLVAASLIFALVNDNWNIRAVCSAVILAACLGVIVCSRKERQYREEEQEQFLVWKEQQLNEACERQKLWEKRQRMEAPKRQKLQANLEWIRSAKREKENLLQTLGEEYDAIRSQGRKKEELEENIAALNLAIDTLNETVAEIYRLYGKQLNQKVSQILSEITGGRYTSVFVDENMQIRILFGEKLLNLNQLSRGTAEQVWFALRMAAGDLIDPSAGMPVILDDAFMTYDDERLKETLKWLSGCGRQVILFSCQKREQELL